MKKKAYIISAFAATALFLTSCGNIPFREVQLWDFILPPDPIVTPMHIDPAPPASEDEGIVGVLAQHPHREVMGEILPDDGIPTAEGYATLPFLPGLTQAEAETALSAANIAFTVETKAAPAPAGVVYAVDYAGVGAGGVHYINPAFPVTLCVSGDKPVYPSATVENTVYITFDDGPDENTVKILDILDTYGIKGTFFLLGDSAKKYPEEVKAIYERGHDVACHSMSHKYAHIYETADNLIAEVDAWVGLMESLGVDFTVVPKLFRYPGGSDSSYFSAAQREVMNQRLGSRGFRIYDWNIVANDALLFQCPEDMTAYDYIVETFISTFEVKKGSAAPKILLLHETVAETEVVLPRIIEYLIGEGCAFAPLSSLNENWTFANED